MKKVRRDRAVSDYKIVTVDSGNVDEFGFFCVRNKKHLGYTGKLSWLQKHSENGVRIKLIVTGDGKRAGFLAYVRG
ncbi:MAG: hypothetical protein JSW03_04310 [Candidatus Eiseniibacteriota bacterium]|nr:MAG: hypothetical protein JSW03_04310 [Candidatus Eisenbacteria bacterium]